MGSVKKVSEIVAQLELRPHREGGFYTETFRDFSINLSTSHLPPRYKVDRPISQAIYFLLPSGSVSHIHRIPSAEVWHFYAGEPVTVFELHEDGKIKLTVLGPDLDAGHRPQYTVPPHTWFASFPTLDVASYSADGSSLLKSASRDPERHYSLVGCTCAPAFKFDDFEVATVAELSAIAPNAEPFLEYLALPN